MDEEKYIAVFASYSHTALLYNKLQELNIDSEIISTPYKLTVGCSKSVVFDAKNLGKVTNAIRINNLLCRGIFEKVIYKNDITYILI
ncbi:hypothetical protein C3495_11955 [Clostridiaceae bacterium 14S0207]|nr:hypothetical protein C3495_11955 [Clostridiaceae bacterium 14S0207]